MINQWPPLVFSFEDWKTEKTEKFFGFEENEVLRRGRNWSSPSSGGVLRSLVKRGIEARPRFCHWAGFYHPD